MGPKIQSYANGHDGGCMQEEEQAELDLWSGSMSAGWAGLKPGEGWCNART